MNKDSFNTIYCTKIELVSGRIIKLVGTFAEATEVIDKYRSAVAGVTMTKAEKKEMKKDAEAD